MWIWKQIGIIVSTSWRMSRVAPCHQSLGEKHRRNSPGRLQKETIQQDLILYFSVPGLWESNFPLFYFCSNLLPEPQEANTGRLSCWPLTHLGHIGMWWSALLWLYKKHQASCQRKVAANVRGGTLGTHVKLLTVLALKSSGLRRHDTDVHKHLLPSSKQKFRKPDPFCPVTLPS